MEDVGFGEQRGAHLTPCLFFCVFLTEGQIVEDGLDFKKKVEEVLEETGFTESRAAKMDINDLLK